MHETAICVIVKDELDLDEWIVYHQEIGFDHIYVYDNNDIPINLDHHQNLTYIHFPGKVQQINAYCDWIKKYKLECKYICVIDADEYVVFNSKYDSVKNVLKNLPDDHDSLILNSKLFVNINETREEGLVLEKNLTWQKFLHRDKWKSKSYLINYSSSVKTFSKTKLIKKIDNPHTFKYYTEHKSYSGDLKSECVVKNFSHYAKEEPQIWINHYYIKSLSEFRHKCLVRGRATTYEKRNLKKELNGSTIRYNPSAILSSEPTEIVLWKNKVKNKLKEKLNEVDESRDN